jgi:hypothetical protein
MPIKPHPTDPDKMVYVNRYYDIPELQGVTTTPSCLCGEPWRLNVVHRDKSACFDYIEHPWVGLTDDEMNEIWADQKRTGESITRAIEAKLKEKNT